jgi:hypothetical protein
MVLAFWISGVCAHKLHNVGTKVRSELKGKEQREERKQLMRTGQ